MAQVTITLTDDEQVSDQLTLDMQFSPPLSDRYSFAQHIALQLANRLGGHRLRADRERLLMTHHRPPAVPAHTSLPG